MGKCGFRVDQEYPKTRFFFKTEKIIQNAKTQKRLEICKINDIPFDQRSLIHREAGFPPCFVRQNQQKTNFFCTAILDNFPTKMFKCETTSFHYFSPRIPNLEKYWTSDFGKWEQKTFKRYLKSEQTHRHTDKQTDKSTYRNHRPRGPMLWKHTLRDLAHAVIVKQK